MFSFSDSGTVWVVPPEKRGCGEGLVALLKPWGSLSAAGAMPESSYSLKLLHLAQHITGAQ